MLRVCFFTILLSAHMALAQTNPIALWSFDESSGSTALDSSGNNHSATILGAGYVPGRTNNSLFFSGTNNYASISDAAGGGTAPTGLDIGTRDWSAAAWIRTTNSGMLLTKMGYVGGSNPDAWGLSISGNGTVGAVLHKASVATVNIFAGDGAIVNDGQWHHVAVVFNRAGNIVRYVDGIATGTPYSLASLSGQSVDNVNQLRIGARDQAGYEVYFLGAIDDARVYSRALTSGEVAALAGVPPPPPPPQPLWSAPVSLVSAYGSIALGNRVHIVGHTGGSLVYRNSQDNGATWSAPSIVAPASVNYPMQYGGLFSIGDTVYLLTAAGDMGAVSQPLDFRKSTNNGVTWSAPIRITLPGQEIRRAIIMAYGNPVHVFGGQSDANGYGTGVFYFRSTNGNKTH